MGACGGKIQQSHGQGAVPIVGQTQRHAHSHTVYILLTRYCIDMGQKEHSQLTQSKSPSRVLYAISWTVQASLPIETTNRLGRALPSKLFNLTLRWLENA